MPDLEECLRKHSKAFEQLLNLIPVKHYFSTSDNSTQWNKRKQTKEESQRAKKAKLDPDSVMSAAGVKRGQLQGKLGSSGDGQTYDETDEVGKRYQASEPMTKRQQKKKELVRTAAGGKKVAKSKQMGAVPDDNCSEIEVEEIQFNGFNFNTQLSHFSLPSQSNPASEGLVFPSKIPPEQRVDQRARLAARIEALRAKRNADLPDGTPARNRNELMAARRREEAVARKERKKEIRLKQKATAEQVGIVALTIKKDSQARGVKSLNNRNTIYPLPDSRDKSQRETRKPSKKVNLKKSRPGFEGGLKSGKKGKSNCVNIV